MKKHSLNSFYSCLAGIPILLAPLSAISAGKHVHGEADLFIAIDQQKVLIELESPAANITGFEHAPSTKKQQQVIRDAIATLGSYSNIIRLENDIACTVNAIDINNPFKESTSHKDEHEHHDEHAHDDHHDHSEQHHDDHGKNDHADHADHADHDKDSHTDFHVSYDLSCPDAQLIKGITVVGFERFSGLENVNVHWVKGDQQSAKKTTSSDNRVDF